MGEPDATPPPRPLLSRPSCRYSRADAGSSGRARNESSIAAIRANRLSLIGGPLVSESARTLRDGASGAVSGARGAARSREHATTAIAVMARITRRVGEACVVTLRSAPVARGRASPPRTFPRRETPPDRGRPSCSEAGPGPVDESGRGLPAEGQFTGP